MWLIYKKKKTIANVISEDDIIRMHSKFNETGIFVKKKKFGHRRTRKERCHAKKKAEVAMMLL